MTSKEPLYKLLNPDGTTPQTGYQWPAPGEWLPPLKGELVACEHAYHVVTIGQVLNWSGPELWTVEYKGKAWDAGDKTLVRAVRRLERVPGWNDKNLRLFACDCAERALARVKEPDPRSVNAIAVARRFAVGKATREEMDAAWDAAWAAAWDAAWDAARDAAWYAAWDAARAAEREWQTKRLRYYILGESQ